MRVQIPVIPNFPALPEPNDNSPFLTRMVTGPFMSEVPNQSPTVPIGWVTGQENPIIPKATIVRMIRGEKEVSVYSILQQQTKAGIVSVPFVHYIPMPWVRLVEGTCDSAVFIDLLDFAESRNDPQWDEADDEASPEQLETPPDAPNGQPTAIS